MMSKSGSWMRFSALSEVNDPMNFSFCLKTEARFGPGVAATLPQFVEKRGYQRVGVILDSGLRQNSHAQELIGGLRGVVKDLKLVENAAAEPTYDYLDEFRKSFDASLDLMVGIGGGSTLDLTKAVSVLATNPRPAISYRGFDLIENPGIPVVAIPTTAGTGSEVTPNAVFTDAKERRKLGINTALYVPVLALLDPYLTLSCPRSVTVSAGMDALVHAVESYVARASTPVSRMFSREAFRILLPNLPAVVERPDDLEARSAMQLGAFYAIIALMNAGGGLTGALSYPLGVLFKVPHGLAGGIFLAKVSRYNAEHGAHQYGDFYDLLDGLPNLLVLHERALAVCDILDRLAGRLGLPSSLEAFGVRETDLDVLAEQTMLLSGAIQQNPAEVTVADIRKILGDLA
ncbi:MAG: iron-containing alcohol dehydrogenase [Candidatus Latescibacteria bacterium]|nr:iron-containing alcohol dehydrogenase [Candidatus Latescibacterota bacterium]